MRKWLVAALLVSLVGLSGCADDSDGDSDDATLDEASGSDQGAGAEDLDTGDGETPDAGALTAALATSVLEGTAPLQVNFTLSVEEQDEANTTWTFDADGDNETDADGTSLPADHTHNYTEAGTYNATLTVGEGDAANATTVSITILEGDSAGELPPQVSFGGSIAAPDPTIGPRGCMENPQPSGGNHMIDGKWIGWDYKVEPAYMQVVFETGGGDVDAETTGSVPDAATRVYLCTDDPAVVTDDPAGDWSYEVTVSHPGHGLLE